MATIYDYLPAEGRPPLDSLDAKSRALLSTEVPAGYPQSKLTQIVALAQQGVSRRARPAAVAQPSAAPPGEMIPAHGPTTPNEVRYRMWPRGKQLYAQAMESVGSEFSQPSLEIPPPQGFTERAASIAGSLAGFVPKATIFAAIPGASPAGAVGAAMATSRGTLKERAIRGVTGAATAGAAGVAGRLAEPVAGPLGHVATSAVGFGAAQPAAESLTHRLTGEPDYPAPTLQDLARGTLEMGFISALFGAPGIARYAAERAARAPSSAQVVEEGPVSPGRQIGRGAPGRPMPGRLRELPPARVPRRRALLPEQADEMGSPIEMPAGEGAPPAVFPPSRRLPQGELPSSGEVRRMPAGTTPEQVRSPVVAKLAPEFANDRRLVAAGRTVGDVFHEMVAAEAGQAPDRASWKAAVRKVVASGRIQAVQDVAAALAEPADAARRGATPEMRAREARFSEELNARAAGRTLTLNLDGKPTRLRVARVAVFRYPGEERPVRVVVEDPANGRLFPLRFRNVAELATAANNPQALVKVSDVFARSEKQRSVRERAAAQRGPAGEGGPEAAPAAATTATAPAAPAAPEAPNKPNVVRIVSKKAEALRARVARSGADRRQGPREGAPERRGERRPIPPEKADAYVEEYASGYAAKHAKMTDQAHRDALVQHLEQRVVDEADPVDRRAAMEALKRIRGGQAGTGEESPGAGPSAPPAAPAAKPAEPAAKRVTIGMEFSDPKKAQAVADRLNQANPGVEAAVVMRRGKPVVEVNEEAARAPEPPKAPERPKAEPAAAPAAEKPETPKAAEGAAEAGRAAGGSAEPPAAPAVSPAFKMKNGDVLRGQPGKTHAELLLDHEPGTEKHIAEEGFIDNKTGEYLTRAQAEERFGSGDAGEIAAGEKYGIEEGPKSRFKPGDRVSVPNNAIRRNDTRSRVEARVVGHEMKNGEPHVIVDVRRGSGRSQAKSLVKRAENAGKFTWVRESFPESKVIKKATAESRAAAQEKRAAKQGRLEQSIREKAGESPARARAIQREWEEKGRAILASAPQERMEGGKSLGWASPADKAAYERAREAYRKTEEAAYIAGRVHEELARKGGGSLAPGAEEFFARSEDAPEWTNPLREAAEDYPQHFTHDRQGRYLRRAADLSIANAREWKSAIEMERGMADRGVGPEHAARAVDETTRLRRFIDQSADNPLVDDAELAGYRALLEPGKIDTPEALAATLKEFDAQVPQGPADDIPAGVQPEPPDGFAAHLNERGIVNAEVLSPWFWLKVLRDVPKNFAKAVRNIPRRERDSVIYDGSGNAVNREPHGLYEPDYWAESALSRAMSRVNLEPGAHVFTPRQRIDYKAAVSDQAHLTSLWEWRRTLMLGKDLAQKLRPYSALSVKLDRVLEGRADISTLPEDVRPAVAKMRTLYEWRWNEVKARYRALGLEEPTSALEKNYVGPRLVLGHISKTVDRLFADFLREKGPTPEVMEMRNRFLHERTGDPNYREDATLRWNEYNRTMSRHLAFLGFFERLKTDMRKMEVEDPRRGAAVLNMLKASLMRKRSPFERFMDNAVMHIRFAKAPPPIDEISLESAASYVGVDKSQLQKGAGIERVFRVPEGASYRVGNDAKAYVLGRIEGVGTLVGTGGAHLFSDPPTLWKAEEAAAKAGIRAKVAVKSAAEAVNRALTGEEGGFLSPHFSKDEHVRMEFAEWRDGVLRSQDHLADAAFRAMGDRITRAVLAYNYRAALANSMQPWLTLAPEIGYRHTMQAIIENALSKGRGKRGAEHIGALQGELARTGELADQPSWFRKIIQAFGPMAPYKYAEDFTRGVSVMGASYLAKRMGYKPAVAQQMTAEIDGRFFDEWQQKIKAMRESGRTENLQATLDTETMFDYNLLGQAPIFGGAIGKVLGRLMTFPGRYARRYVTRPLGGAAKVARAVALGTADRATGGALARAGMPVDTKPQGYGKYPAPKTEFDKFLDYYGAKWHDRQGARVMLRQMQMLGVLSAVTGGTHLNAFLVGTPGWERIPLLVLLSLAPKGSKWHDKLKAMVDATQRSAIIDPERAVENTMSPLLRTAYQIGRDSPDAWAQAYNKAQKGDPLGTAAALSKPLTRGLQETGLQLLGAPLVASRRAFQQMPWAEQFFSTPAGKTFAHLMGIRSYIKGNGTIGFVKGIVGLTPPAEEEARRVRIDQKPKKAKIVRGGRSRSRRSIYSALEPAMPQGAFA